MNWFAVINSLNEVAKKCENLADQTTGSDQQSAAICNIILRAFVDALRAGMAK